VKRDNINKKVDFVNVWIYLKVQNEGGRISAAPAFFRERINCERLNTSGWGGGKKKSIGKGDKSKWGGSGGTERKKEETIEAKELVGRREEKGELLGVGGSFVRGKKSA